MSVSCDVFLGYKMDITADLKNFISRMAKNNSYGTAEDCYERFYDMYVGDEVKSVDDSKLKALNFVPFYSRKGFGKGDIVLLEDGMCSSFTWLVYIHSVKLDTNDPDTNENLNSYLRKQPVPEEVDQHLRECYKLIFKDECKNDIHLEEFAYYH